jgi:hypothetical protein
MADKRNIVKGGAILAIMTARAFTGGALFAFRDLLAFA